MSIKQDMTKGGAHPGLGLTTATADSAGMAKVVGVGGTMHLAYIHRTRAIAIVLIVALHCLDRMDWSTNHQTYRLMVEILQGATLDFMMISGFLFAHLRSKYEYTHYLKTKFKNVIIPYLVVGLPGIALLLSKPLFLELNPELSGWPLWLQAGFLYVYGGSQLNHVMWFIPVLTIYFLLSPLFMYVLERPIWFLSLVVLIPLSLLAHRPSVQKYHHLELALYFLPGYMSGMLASLYKDKVLAFSQRYFYLLVAGVLATLLGHFYLSDFDGSYVEEVFSGERGLIDWVFIQKFLLFFVLIALMKRMEAIKMRTVDYVATVSFAIFFVHLYVLHIYSHVVHWHLFPGTVFNTIVLALMTVAGSVGLAYVVRRLFGASSRYLIGA